MDLLALRSMAGAIAVGRHLAGAILAVMLAGGSPYALRALSDEVIPLRETRIPIEGIVPQPCV